MLVMPAANYWYSVMAVLEVIVVAEAAAALLAKNNHHAAASLSPIDFTPENTVVVAVHLAQHHMLACFFTTCKTCCKEGNFGYHWASWTIVGGLMIVTNKLLCFQLLLQFPIHSTMCHLCATPLAFLSIKDFSMQLL